MRRIPGHVISLILATLLMSAAAFGQSQSLGDIARANREKKAAESSSSTPPKVITNKNLPQDPDATSEDGSATPSTPKSDSPFSEKTAKRQPARYQSTEQRPAEQYETPQRENERRAAAQWKRRILQQESMVATLRMRVDRLRATIRLANVSTYNDMPVNRYQARQMERLRQVQHQLDVQQRKLEDLQEAARHAGMHTLVYDP